MATYPYEELPAVTTGANCPQPLGTQEISAKIRHLIEILNEFSIGPAGSSVDLSAIGWIVQSLEDIEATIVGLAHNEQATQGSPLPPLPVYKSINPDAIPVS